MKRRVRPRKPVEKWNRIFALLPVRTSDDYLVWLEPVWRCIEHGSGDNFHVEYRVKKP